MTFGYIAIELLVGFIGLLFLTKLLGKTQISQLTPFDFISALILGELLGNAIYDEKIHVGFILYATVFWGALIYVTDLITQKVRKTRSFLEGEPSIIIRKGEIDRLQLKKNKLDIDQLQNLLRQKDVFSVREIEFAILESNGQLSVLKKPKYSTPTMTDLNLPLPPVSLATTLISDGIVDEGNLQEIGFNYAWLMQQLKKYNVSDPRDVLFAEWKMDEGFYCQKFEKKL